MKYLEVGLVTLGSLAANAAGKDVYDYTQDITEYCTDVLDGIDRLYWPEIHFLNVDMQGGTLGVLVIQDWVFKDCVKHGVFTHSDVLEGVSYGEAAPPANWEELAGSAQSVALVLLAKERCLAGLR